MSSIADFNNDDWLGSVVTYEPAQAAVVIRLQAKQSIRIVEVQGPVASAEAFGLSMPDGFRKMLFGEGANIPEEMKRDVEHMNRLNFRWGCSIPLKAGATFDLRIPAAGPGKDRVFFNLTYEYPKAFGLLKGKNGFCARMTPD